MKIVLFSDLHIFAHLNRTQFEDIAINFLLHLLKYCKQNNIHKIFFLGDFFHIKNKLYVPPFIKSLDILRSFRDQGIEITFLIGNHDAPQMNSTDHSVMYAFQDFGKVVPLYDWEDIGDVRLHFLSYTNELPKFELGNKKNILFGHLDIENFLMESGAICNEGFSQQSFQDFDYVFSGHFHKHQIKNNIIYIGSPYQTRYSERHDDKGFIVLDTDDLSWKFNIYNKAPKFKEINFNNEFNSDENGNIVLTSEQEKDISKLIKGNFIRIKTYKDNQNLSIIKDKMIQLGAESVDFIFEDINEEKELNMIEELTMGSMKELASAYFDNVKDSDLFPETIKILLENNKIDKNDFMNIFQKIEESHLSGWKPEQED